jgi:hypothetical protein
MLTLTCHTLAFSHPHTAEWTCIHEVRVVDPAFKQV